MKNKTNFKISKRTIIWMCILCAVIFTASVIVAQNIFSKYDNTYSIEKSRLYSYQIESDN